MTGLAVILALAFAAVSPIKISATPFKTLPASLVYLDATTILLHERTFSTSHVWRSVDSGESWTKSDIENVKAIVQSPLDRSLVRCANQGILADRRINALPN